MLQQAIAIVRTDRADVDRPAVAQDFLGAVVSDVGDRFLAHRTAARASTPAMPSLEIKWLACDSSIVAWRTRHR